MSCINHTSVPNNISNDLGSFPISSAIRSINIEPKFKGLVPLDIEAFEPQHREAAEDANRYLSSIMRGEIPERLYARMNHGFSKYFMWVMYDYWSKKELRDTENDFGSFRDVLTENGIWSIVDKHVAKELADKLKGKKVLEVMAGSGWWSKALAEQGLEVTATDNFSTHPSNMQVFPVMNLDDIEAVKRLGKDYDVLMVSWPPYENETFMEACRLWGEDKPIIYIGETSGDCCGTDELFKHLKVDERIKDFDTGFDLRDKCQIVHWSNEEVSTEYQDDDDD